MNELNSITQEINKGKNLNVNLEKYIKSMSSMYNSLALIKLSMNYYSLYDLSLEITSENDLFLKHFNSFNKLCALYISGERDLDKSIDDLRNTVTGVMEVVVAYTDRLRIYEHVLNRVEYKFKKSDYNDEYYNTSLTNDLMHYILSDKDNVVIHSKIAEVVGQLPMRLSKNKFYEHLRDAFTLYRGSKKDSVDDFAFSLKSTSMLIVPKNYDTVLPDIKAVVDTLSAADYSNIDEAEFDRLYGELKTAAERVNNISDLFVLLIAVINDLYTAVITEKYTLGETEETSIAKDIITAINEKAALGEVLSEDILDKFVLFEGKQERIVTVIDKNSFIIDDLKERYNDVLKELNLLSGAKALADSVKLQSGSDFVKLIDMVIEDIDDEYPDKVCDELIDEYTEMFKGTSVHVRRAIMANVLSQLPVFFNNTQEIQGYINASLMQCSDFAEKAAVVDIFKQIISNN